MIKPLLTRHVALDPGLMQTKVWVTKLSTNQAMILKLLVKESGWCYPHQVNGCQGSCKTLVKRGLVDNRGTDSNSPSMYFQYRVNGNGIKYLEGLTG